MTDDTLFTYSRIELVTLIANVESFSDTGFSFLEMVRSYKKFEEDALDNGFNRTARAFSYS